MPIQRLSARDVTALKNLGKHSEQLVWHRNAPDAAMTITRVTMDPGAVSTLHAHAKAEQVWLIEQGAGTLLMDGGKSEVKVGEIIRTPAGEAHGIVNSGTAPLVYLAITVPPEDFAKRYADEEQSAAKTIAPPRGHRSHPA
jgi:mannose-6-phosphate isomerase-like protein (cupin superfamily)